MMQTNRCQQVIERFEYPVIPFAAPVATLFELAEDAQQEAGIESECVHNISHKVPDVEAHKLLEEQKLQAFAAGREQGLHEGRQLEHEAHNAAARIAEQQRSIQMTQLVEQFEQQRNSYMQEVEQEVVKLALAVAARILRREAQMDPLLLTGAVRVALGQVAGSTEVRLRVPQAELDLWKESIALLPNLAIKPKVIAGEGLRIGDCTIETKLGSADLGIRSQLAEIERGFFGSAREAPTAQERASTIGSAEGNA